MNCSYTGPNGQPSILAQQLLDEYKDPAIVDRVMSFIYGDQFEAKFGTWITKSNQFNWARTAPNGYEVSSAGDKRFSALFARLKDGRTIEEAYQLDIKGYRSQGNDWKLGKGKPPLNPMTKEASWEAYKNLWRTYLVENPDIAKDLKAKAAGKILTDKFASTDVSQARALSEILNATIKPTVDPTSQIPIDEQALEPTFDWVQDVVIPLIDTTPTAKNAITESTENGQKVYTQFGTSYRFTDSNGVIVGEYRQGNGEWKAMTAKTAKDKYTEFTVSGTKQEVKPVKPGVDFVYTATPELAEIGTQEQYTQYLDTIFPDSKVKDIVYHGTKNYDSSGKEKPKFDKFDKSFIGKSNGLRSDDMAKGFYFGSYAIADRVGTRIIPVILDIQDVNNTTVRRNTKDFDTTGDVFVVFEPEQIHILGSKADIEGFKDWLNKQEVNSIQNVAEPTSQLNGIVYDNMSGATEEVAQNQPEIKFDSYVGIAMTEPTQRHYRSEPESKETIQTRIRTEIIQVALANPTVGYKLRYVDMEARRANFSGYSNKDYAAIFDEMRDEFPPNVIFSPTLQGAMDNSSGRRTKEFAKMIEDQGLRVPRNMNGQIIDQQREQMLIPIVNAQGQTVSLFDEVEQDTAFKTVMQFAYRLATTDTSKPIVAIFGQTLRKMQELEQILLKDPKKAAAAKTYGDIVRSFAFMDNRPSFASQLLEGFKSLGYSVSPLLRLQLMAEMSKQKSIYATQLSTNTATFDDVNSMVDSIMNDDQSNSFETGDDMSTVNRDGARGRGNDWTNQPFDINPRDTASTRIKLGLSTILEHDYGYYNLTDEKPLVTTYINHSGGADGGDTAWDQIGREFGVTDQRHYREPGKDTVDSTLLRAKGIKAIPLSQADYNEGIQKATQAAKDLGRKISVQYGHYQYRNWAQVKYADAVFAVSTLLNKGDKDKKGYVAKTVQVEGGTGYAVQMAINEGKPVYLFDEKRLQWYKNIDGVWSKSEVPTLTQNFAGIGTRGTDKKLTAAGEQAIRAVYANSIKPTATGNKETALDLSHYTSASQVTMEDAVKANRKGVYHPDPILREAILERLNTEFEILPFRNNLMTHELVALDEVYESALMTLAGESVQTVDNYIGLLNASRNPNMKALANWLSGRTPGKAEVKPNVQVQNEFVKVMSLQYNPFLLVTSKIKTGDNGEKYSETRLLDAQRGNQLQTIINEWREFNKISQMMIVKDNGARVLDVKRAREKHLPLVYAYDYAFNKLGLQTDKGFDERFVEMERMVKAIGFPGTVGDFIADANGNRVWMKAQFKEIFAEYGMELDDNMINGLLGKYPKFRMINGEKVKEFHDYVEDLTKGSKHNGDLAKQFKITTGASPKPEGSLSAFFMKAAGISSEHDTAEEDIDDVAEQVMLNHPMYTENTAMRALASVTARFTPVLFSNTHKDLEGKTKYDFSYNTSLSKLMQRFDEDFNGMVSEYQQMDLINSGEGENPDSEGSFYLRHWAGNTKARADFRLYYLEGLRYGTRENGVTRQSMSDREQIVMSVLAYQNKGRKLGHMMSLTHSDKTTTPMFYNVPKIDTGIRNEQIEPLREMKKLFYAEHRRIVAQAGIDYNDKKYNAGKNYFFFLPQFNKEAMEAKAARGEMIYDTNIPYSPEVIAKMWYPDGTMVGDSTDFDFIVEQEIQKFMKELTQNTLDNWKKNGITSTMLDRDTLKKIKNELPLKGGAKATVEDIQAHEDEVLRIMARDYALNHFIWNVNSSLLFYGDPAQLWKAVPGGTVLDNVDSTMKQYAKRLAKDIAPGQDLAFEPGEKYQAITLADVNPAQEYITKHMIKNKTQGTDAQEVTTVAEDLRVRFAGGLIPEADYNTLMQIVNNPDENGWYDFTDDQLKIIMQPMKPVYAGFRAPANGAMLYDYVKSSAYPLIPRFTKGTSMDELRKYMEGKNIARAHFESAKKIGAPAKPAKVFSDDGKSFIPGNYDSAIQTLDRSGFRIQQEVPYDEDKEAIKIVSQMNKLIVEGLGAVNTTFRIGDKEFDSASLREHKETIRKKMLDKNMKEFKDRISTKGKLDKRKIADFLREEAAARNYTANEINVLKYIDEEGNFIMPLLMHPSVEKFEALIMSMVRKVLESKIPGKSYVQASSVGYTRKDMRELTDADKAGIVWMEGHDQTEPLRHQQLIENADGTKTVIPAQVIAPFNFFIDGKKQSVRDFLIPGTNTLDKTRVPKELLQLIGARIPNQGHNSMIAIEIVGFTDDAMGDIMFVPSAITGQMGSDFDVDKLYTYKRPYTHENGAFKPITSGDTVQTRERLGANSEEWDNLKAATEELLKLQGAKQDEEGLYPRDVYNKALGEVVTKLYPEGNVPKHTIEIKREKQAETKESLQRDYFDVHWAVLTNADMYAKVLNPLDKPDLKDMNALYTDKKEKFYSYYDAVAQQDDFQSGKGAKALVGLTSLAVTFNSVIQNKNLALGTWVKKGKATVAEERSIEVMYNGELLNLRHMSGNGTNMYNGDIRTKHDNHTTIQSGAVDNANERVIDSLNINLSTFPALQALYQLEDDKGKIVNIDFGSALTVQPIIWEFSNRMRQGNDSMSEEFIPKLKSNIISKLRAEYTTAYFTALGVKTDEQGEYPQKVIDKFLELTKRPLSIDTLNKAWNMNQEGKSSPEYWATQIAAINLFETLDMYGERLGILQKTFNQDTNGAGPNLIYALQQQSNYDKLWDKNEAKVFHGEDSIAFHAGQKTEQGHLFTEVVDTAVEVGEELLPVNAMKAVVNTVGMHTNKTSIEIPINTQRKYIRALRSYSLTATDVFGDNARAERVRLLIGTSELETLAVRTERMKIKHPDNHFLARLNTRINVLGNGPDFVEYQNAKTIRLDDEKNVNAFMSMLNSEDRDLKLFAEDLIRYTYLVNPQNGPTSFIKHIPTSYLVATDVAKDMTAMMDRIEQSINPDTNMLSDDQFIEQMFQHNPAATLPITSETFGKFQTVGQEYPETFMIHADSNPNLQVIIDDNAMHALYVHYRASSGKAILYKLLKTGEYSIYQRMDTLGTGDKTEYNAKAGAQQRSIFPDNRALQAFGTRGSVSGDLDMFVNRMIRTSRNESNAYANWGLGKEGTMDDMNNALAQMGNDKSLPTYYRTVADLLSMGVDTSTKALAHEVFDGLFKPNAFKVKVGPLDHHGSYNAGTNTLSLQIGEGNSVQAAETILHEMSHQRTSAIAYALGYFSDEQAKALGNDRMLALLPKIEAFQKNNPELHNKVKALDRLRYEALNAWRKAMEAQGIDPKEIVEDVENGIVQTKDQRIYYALRSMHEFIAGVYTNDDVMRFLNGIETTTKRNWVQQIWDLISDMLILVKEFIGQDVKSNSILKEAFGIVMNLTNETVLENMMMEVQNEQVVPTTLSVLSETQADELKYAIETGYGQQATTSNEGTHFNVLVNYRRVGGTVALDPTVQKVVDSLNNQIKELKKIQSTRVVTPEDRERFLKVSGMIRELEEDLQDVKQHQELQALGELGAKQLQWVENILKKPNPHVQEFILAMNLVNVWNDLDELVYDEAISNVKPEFADMVAKTQHQASTLYMRMMSFGTQAMQQLGVSRGLDSLTYADFGKNLRNTDMASYQFITASRNGNDAMQLVTSMVQDSANSRDEDSRRLKLRLDKLQKLLGKDFKNWNQFIQETDDGHTFGLVQELSPEWYRFNSEGQTLLKNSIYGANVNHKRGTPENIASKRKSFKKFWKEVKTKATYVDLNELLDFQTGAQHTDGRFEAERTRLVGLTGSETVVDEAIQNSIATYLDYIDHREAAHAEYDNLELTDAELDGIDITDEQNMTMTPDEIEAEMLLLMDEKKASKIQWLKDKYVYENSPIAFLKSQKIDGPVTSFMHTMSYLPEFIPLANKDMFDAKYTAIKADTNLWAVYKEFQAMSQEFRAMLPPNEQKRLHNNFLPIVSQQDVEEVFKTMGKLSKHKVGQAMLNALSVSEYEKDRVAKDDIPLRFLHRGGYAVADLSKNLPKLFEMFGNMALHYNYMRPMLEVIQTMEVLVSKEATMRATGQHEGKPLNNLIALLDFYKKSMIFKQAKEVELASENPTYSLNPWTQRKKERQALALEEEFNTVADRIDELEKLPMTPELLAEKAILDNRLEEIYAEQEKLRKEGRFIAGSKVADTMIGINQLKALSFNPFSAVNNFVFGTMSAYIHSFGKVDYTPKELNWGFKKMKGSIGKSLSFGTREPGDARKIHNIMERTGVLTEILDTMYGQTNLSAEQKSALRRSINPYQWQKTGDYLHKGAMLLAMMKHTKVKVQVNGVEEEINLYDALNDEGEWNEQQFGERPEWSNQDISKQTEWNKFRNKARKVAIIVHGNQDKNAMLVAKSKMLTRLIGQFRMSWLSEGINTRIGKKYNDAELGREVKGRWRTYFELGLFSGSPKLLLRQIASKFTGKDAFAGVVNRKNEALSETDKENMRKNLAGLTATIAVLILYQIAKGLGPSEEEKRRRRKQGAGPNWNQLVTNMLFRSYQDLMLYSSPSVADQVTGNLIPSLNVITDAMKAIKATAYLPFNDRKNAGKETLMKDLKAVPFLNLVPKFAYMFGRPLENAAR